MLSALCSALYDPSILVHRSYYDVCCALYPPTHPDTPLLYYAVSCALYHPILADCSYYAVCYAPNSPILITSSYTVCCLLCSISSHPDTPLLYYAVSCVLHHPILVHCSYYAVCHAPNSPILITSSYTVCCLLCYICTAPIMLFPVLYISSHPGTLLLLGCLLCSTVHPPILVHYFY
jgi:hypothetical protein